MAKPSGTDAHRERILRAAAMLLSKSGRDAVTTRSVAEAAKVQPPVLYRLFGDKDGLLEAVAEYGFLGYLAKKPRPAAGDDPVASLRAGWDLHVEFGLANPELYLLMYAKAGEAAIGAAARHAGNLLRQHMRSVASAGRLRVDLDLACDMYHAAAAGVVLDLLAKALEDRDRTLSTAMRDLMLARITGAAEPDAGAKASLAITANRLSALLSETGDTNGALSKAEALLMKEWLQKLVKHTP